MKKCFTVTVTAAKILEIIITTNEDQCKRFIVANATEEKFIVAYATEKEFFSNFHDTKNEL